MARKKLGLSKDKKIIVYTGSPFKWKGVLTLADATKEMKDTLMVFVGGNSEEPGFMKLKAHAKHAQVTSYVPYAMVPDYLAASDLLVIPNSAKDPISREDTSPLKLFEYMASGRKIVASDVPALKAVLSEETAWFFKADDVADLKTVLAEALKSKLKKGEAAQKAVRSYTWKKRVKSILEFMAI